MRIPHEMTRVHFSRKKREGKQNMNNIDNENEI